MSARIFKKEQPRRSAARQNAAPATKYYRAGSITDKSSPFESKKLQPKPKRRSRKLLFGAADTLVLLAVAFGLVYSLIVRPDPTISASSAIYHTPATYRQAVIKQFQIFKNRNKITLDDQAIIKNLQTQFPEIANGTVELPLFGETPIVHLNIASPSFFLNSSGNLYVVDAQGYVVARSTSLPDVKNVLTLSDQSGFGAKIGHQAMSSDNVSFINTVIAETKRAKVPISSLTLPALAQELDLRTSDRGYYVKFFLGGDVLQESGQFLAARHNFDQTGSQPSQYLDVRVPGKIYYK